MAKTIDVADALRNAWLFTHAAALSAACWEDYLGVSETPDGRYAVRQVTTDNTLIPGPAWATTGTPEGARLLVMARRGLFKPRAMTQLRAALVAQDARNNASLIPPPVPMVIPVKTDSGAVIEIDRKAVIAALRPQTGDMTLELRPDGTLRVMLTVEGLDVRRLLAKPVDVTEAELEFVARWRRISAHRAEQDEIEGALKDADEPPAEREKRRRRRAQHAASRLHGGGVCVLQDPVNGEWVGCKASGKGRDQRVRLIAVSTDPAEVWAAMKAAHKARYIERRDAGRDAAKRSYEAKKARRGY